MIMLMCEFMHMSVLMCLCVVIHSVDVCAYDAATVDDGDGGDGSEGNVYVCVFVYVKIIVMFRCVCCCRCWWFFDVDVL